MDIEIIADYACVCGEGPIWHTDEAALYWCDIPKGRLFRFDHASGEHEQLLEDRHLGGSTIQDDGSLALLRDEGNVVLFRDGQIVQPDVIEKIPHETRFNDAIADPEGRVYSGTMPVDADQKAGIEGREGRLYRIDPDSSFRIMSDGYGCANGMGFTADLSTLYFVDSNQYSVFAFDYDRETGELGERRVFTEVDRAAKPDGMTVDAEDHVWVAFWEGGCVRRYDPTGRQVRKIDLPTPLITSVMFGGPDLDELYITSAGGNQKDKRGEHAGALFRITDLGITGRPEYRSKLRINLNKV